MFGRGLATGFFDLDHDGVLGRPECQRSPAVGGQHIDAAAPIHAIRAGSPPGALGKIDHAGKNPGGDPGGDDQRTPIIPDPHGIAVAEASRFRIDRVDEQSLRKRLLQPIVIGMGGMDPGKSMMPDGLKGIS